jgi:hypothetical protein
MDDIALVVYCCCIVKMGKESWSCRMSIVGRTAVVLGGPSAVAATAVLSLGCPTGEALCAQAAAAVSAATAAL